MQAKGASPLVCNVYQQCITGIGDKYLDVIMGAALSQLSGCKMPVVHMQQHWSSHTHDRMVKFDRNSNFSRVVSSSSGEPLFVTDQVCPSSNLSQWTNGSCVRKGWHLPLVVFYPCGAKRPSWIMESLLQRFAGVGSALPGSARRNAGRSDTREHRQHEDYVWRALLRAQGVGELLYPRSLHASARERLAVLLLTLHTCRER